MALLHNMKLLAIRSSSLKKTADSVHLRCCSWSGTWGSVNQVATFLLKKGSHFPVAAALFASGSFQIKTLC